MRRLLHALLTLTLALAGLAFGNYPAAGTEAGCWDTAWRCRDVNEVRAEHGRASLIQQGTLQAEAGVWADELAASGVLRHDPDVVSGEVNVSEIVGYGPDWPTVLVAFMASEHHREILLGRYDRVGIGVQRADGLVFVVVRFR